MVKSMYNYRRIINDGGDLVSDKKTKKPTNIKLLLQIYLTFFKLGSVSFGGGFAVISLMEREIVEDKKWVDKEKIIDIFAIAQSLPGAVALNASAFVGFSIAGIPGAIAGLLGSLTPSVIVMLILSSLLAQFNNNTYVQKAFNGIRPIIVGLISYAAFKIGETAIKNIYCIIIAVIAFLLAVVLHISVIYIIIGGIVVGILLSIYQYKFMVNKNNTNGNCGE